jgi:hypothetical protein
LYISPGIIRMIKSFQLRWAGECNADMREDKFM